jgi:hypothetical protein
MNLLDRLVRKKQWNLVYEQDEINYVEEAPEKAR